MAISSSISSPFCTWFLATYMAVGSENQSHAPSKLSLFDYYSKRLLTQITRRKKNLVKCSGSNNGDGATSYSISSLYGSSWKTLMNCCQSLEPCEHFYSYYNVSSLFGSKSPSTNRRNSHRNAAAVCSALAVEPEKEVMLKKTPLTKHRRVVVTGVSVVTSIGEDADTFYNNLLDGVSGISQIQAFDCSQFPTKIAGEIKSFSPNGWISPKLSKRADKFVLYLLTAGKKALADGRITEQVMNKLDKLRCGVIVGSALGGINVFSNGVEALRVSYKKMNPFCVPFATTNVGSAMLAMDLGWMGPSYSISSACATSNSCILNAANHIIRGETDMMLCGGSDAPILPIGLGGFVACRALSERNKDPTKASRPWDTGRDGFVLGEGAGVLLLEELEHAKKRGAKIYAEFLGGSFTSDAYHLTEPHPNGMGVELCMEQALAQSGVSKEDVNYINAHATSTQTGDLREFQALVRCFGRNPELKVNSTKSMIGHLLGASGAVEAVATVKAIETGWIHPNINLENPDEDMDTSILVGARKEFMEIKVALSNSFGFGGHNSSILFAPFK